MGRQTSRIYIGNLAGRTIKLRKIGQTNPRTIFVRTASGMVDLTDRRNSQRASFVSNVSGTIDLVDKAKPADEVPLKVTLVR